MKSKIPLLICLLHAPLFAADDEVSVKFRAVAPGLAPLTVGVSAAGNESLFEIPEGIRSAVQKYQGSPQTLFRDVTGRRMFPVAFPADHKLLLVVLRLGPDGEPSSVVLEDDEDASQAGSLRLVNIGNEPLRIEAGDATADLEPGGNTTLPSDGKKTIFIRVRRPATGDVLMSNNWALAPGSRTLAIFDPGATPSASVRVYRFSETAPLKK